MWPQELINRKPYSPFERSPFWRGPMILGLVKQRLKKMLGWFSSEMHRLDELQKLKRTKDPQWAQKWVWYIVYIMSLLILSKTINGHTMYIDSYSKPGTIIYVILINYFGCYNVMLLQFNTLCLTLHTTNLSDKTSVALANPEVYSIKSKFKMASTANTYYIHLFVTSNPW